MRITHVNHASLLVESDGEFVLTDPWYLSPAFGGWVQSPSPAAETIRAILDIPPGKLRVVISHGHDDHLDEFVVSHHLKSCQVFVPRYKTPGLSKRVERLTGRYPTELTEQPISSGPFSLSACINDDFTQYDAVVPIATANHLLIHANDNWHAYPEALIDHLRSLVSRFETQNVFFLVQFGIADCFPLSYPGYTGDEALAIVQKRFDGYGQAIRTNITRLGLPVAYTYANQSTYRYPAPFTGMSLYEMAQPRIASAGFKQLTPRSVLTSRGLTAATSESLDLFTHCLTRIESAVQEKFGDGSLRFLLPEETPAPDEVAYQADKATWQRILIGDLTLEAITIGGMGLVRKPTDKNIAAIHHRVSKLTYPVQAEIRAKGLTYCFHQ